MYGFLAVFWNHPKHCVLLALARSIAPDPADEVVYSAETFLMKNTDKLSKDSASTAGNVGEGSGAA